VRLGAGALNANPRDPRGELCNSRSSPRGGMQPVRLTIRWWRTQGCAVVLMKEVLPATSLCRRNQVRAWLFGVSHRGFPFWSAPRKARPTICNSSFVTLHLRNRVRWAIRRAQGCTLQRAVRVSEYKASSCTFRLLEAYSAQSIPKRKAKQQLREEVEIKGHERGFQK